MWNRNFSLVIIFIISNVFSFRVLPWNHGISSLVYPLYAVADIEQFTWLALYLFTRTYPRDYVNSITRIRNLCSGCDRCWVEYLKRFRMMHLRIKTSARNRINRFPSFPPKLILVNFREITSFVALLYKFYWFLFPSIKEGCSCDIFTGQVNVVTWG